VETVRASLHAYSCRSRRRRNEPIPAATFLTDDCGGDWCPVWFVPFLESFPKERGIPSFLLYW